MSERLRAILNSADEDGDTVADKILRAGIEAAENGDFRFWKEILDRIDGPVSSKIEIDKTIPLVTKVVGKRMPVEEMLNPTDQ
jgi:hypothetical protein